MDKKSSRALLLILTTLTYLLLGAAVFDQLESGEEGKLREEIASIRAKLQKKYNFEKSDVELFEIIAMKGVPHKAGLQWHFSGALYFAVVVITTVGYGHSAPQTPAGKLFCMLFALFGIPLGLIMFQSIGERVNTGIAYCLHKLRDNCQSRGIYLLGEITPKHLIIVSLTVGNAIIILGTWVFHQEEQWSLFDAYYYCFVTLSTVGFGDYVPLQQGGALQARPGYVVFTLLFVIVGLAVFSACVNLLVLGLVTLLYGYAFLSFMAPNADEVTAAEREPRSTIVFERFARSSSLVDSQLLTCRRQSQQPRASPKLSTNRHPHLFGEANHVAERGQGCLKCRTTKKKSNEGQPKFSFVRPPSQNIRHLLEHEISEESETMYL